MEWGLKLTYAVQEKPDGIAKTFIIGEEFLDNGPAALVLGDSLFFGMGFTPMLKKAAKLKEGALVFSYQVKDPNRFGVVEFGDNQKAISLE